MTASDSPPGRRWLMPPALVLAVALVASVAMHVPAYVGLGFLKVLLAEPPAATSRPIEIDLVVSEPAPPSEPEESEPLPEDVEEADDQAPELAERSAPETRPEAAEPPEEDVRAQLPQPVVVTPPPTARPEPRNRTSVAHRSRDPNVEPPPEAQYLAEENSRVEEETMARVRNPNLDDPEPQAPSASEPTPPAEEEGDAAEEEMAELQDAPGSDERDPTPEETRVEPPRDRPREASRSPTPSVSEAAQGDARGGGAEASGQARAAGGGGRMARGGGVDRPMREIVVSDGHGSFTVRVPIEERPAGEGEGEGGGPAIAGTGRGREGEGRAAGRSGRSGRRARGGAARGAGAPNLRVSWSQFSTLYGEEELERDREAYLEQRRSRVAGVSRAERWQRFRAAIENYDVRVRPGNQTALNTRADPFAAYIAAMHRRIHPRFAGGYLMRVPSTVEPVYRANPDMNTKLELAIDGEGRVDHVSVVNTSGDTLFDLGAYESVMGAQPFPATPEAIRSPDGLVYMHWSFYRNHRQCGTFNAEAFILASAPTPRRRRGDPDPALIDRGPAPLSPSERERPSGLPPAATPRRDTDT